MSLKNVQEIIKLSKLSKKKLRKLNANQDRLYTGTDLSKDQLIFQIVFFMDAPKK